MAKWKRAREAAHSPAPTRPATANVLIEPTADERRNGWTAESLTNYVREREAAATTRVFPEKKPRPTQANSRYNPHRCWR